MIVVASQTALFFAIGCLGLALICNIWTIATAKTASDRVLALDTGTINVIALIVLIGILGSSKVLFEVAMLFAMTGFVGTVAYGRHILRGDLIE